MAEALRESCSDPLTEKPVPAPVSSWFGEEKCPPDGVMQGDSVGAAGTEEPMDLRRQRGPGGLENSREELTQHPPAVCEAELASDKPKMNTTGALPRKSSV